MEIQRKVKNSLRDGLATIFSDYTVYGRDDWNRGFDRNQPYLFIVQADPAYDFQLKHLPVVVIETNLIPAPFQMGTNTYALVEFAYHIFCSSQAQLDDICDRITKNQKSVDIIDYDNDNVIIDSPKLVPIRGRYWTGWNIGDSPYVLDDMAGVYGKILSSAIETLEN